MRGVSSHFPPASLGCTKDNLMTDGSLCLQFLGRHWAGVFSYPDCRHGMGLELVLDNTIWPGLCWKKRARCSLPRSFHLTNLWLEHLDVYQSIKNLLMEIIGWDVLGANNSIFHLALYSYNTYISIIFLYRCNDFIQIYESCESRLGINSVP